MPRQVVPRWYARTSKYACTRQGRQIDATMLYSRGPLERKPDKLIQIHKPMQAHTDSLPNHLCSSQQLNTCANAASLAQDALPPEKAALQKRGSLLKLLLLYNIKYIAFQLMFNGQTQHSNTIVFGTCPHKHLVRAKKDVEPCTMR